MKRFVTVIAVALTLALAGTYAHAAKPEKAAAKGDKAARAAKRAEGGIGGTVLKVADGVITLQTRGKKAAEVNVTVDANTKFEGVASAADIKPGMQVMATPNGGTAQKVVVRDGKGKANKANAAKRAERQAKKANKAK